MKYFVNIISYFLVILLVDCGTSQNQNSSTPSSSTNTSATDNSTLSSLITTTIIPNVSPTHIPTTTSIDSRPALINSTTSAPVSTQQSKETNATFIDNNSLNLKNGPTSDDQDVSDSAPSAHVQSRNTRDFTENFSQCKRNTPEFDKCMKNGLNNIRSFIVTGVPELNLPSFDPISAKEVVLRRGGPVVNYKLKLKNVRESGWRMSEVTKFRSNLKQNMVQITQYFPEKRLHGDYEVESQILQPSSNKGKFSLDLYDLNQTTTITRPKGSKNLRVKVDVQEIGDMKLHISNLLRGRTLMENVLDRMINSPIWRPGFMIVRPFVNELVTTAFTDIYNNAFNNYNFDRILPPA